MLGPAFWHSGSVDVALFGLDPLNLSRTTGQLLTIRAGQPPPAARLHQT